MEITAKHLYPYIFLFNGIYPFNSMIRKEYKHKKNTDIYQRELRSYLS